MTLFSALILITGFSISLLLIPRTGLRRVFAPFRSNALLAYAHVLPSWSHPYFDLLKLAEEQSGTYLRLRATTAITALSSAIFIRVLLGQLVPANASILILLSGLGFIGLIHVERSNVRPSLQRTQNLIHLKISRPLNRAMALEVVGSKRLRDASLNTLETLIAAPGKMANLASHQLLPFMGDVITAFIMVAIFIVLTGGSYFFVLSIYMIYVFAELFLAYSRERSILTDDQKLSQAVLTSFRHHPNDYLSSGLMDVVCSRLQEYKQSQSGRKLEESLSVNRESLGGEIANDVVIILMLLILLAQASLTPGQAGQFIAGLLVLFRLTGTIRSAIRKYFKAKADAMQSRGLEDHCSRVLRRYAYPGESDPGRRKIPTSSPKQLGIQISRGVIDLRSQAIPSSRAQLRSVDLHLAGPGCIGITGDSGAGKTTLLRVLSGIYDLQRGEVRLNARNLKQYSHADISSRVLLLSRESLLLPIGIREALGNRLWGFGTEQTWHGASNQDTSLSPHEADNSWEKMLLHWMSRQEMKLICLDQPEFWLASARKNLPEDWLERLSQHNLVVMASRDVSLLKRCKTVYLMQSGLCKEVPQPSRTSNRR